MAVNSVSFSQAMRSASSAQQYLRSGNISESERAQLVIKWGADKVEKWSTVDSTEYVIEDDAIANAKDAGSNAAAESTGYDGSKDHGRNAYVDGKVLKQEQHLQSYFLKIRSLLQRIPYGESENRKERLLCLTYSIR